MPTRNNGSLRLWFWTLTPAIFVGGIFLISLLDKYFDIGDRSLDLAIALAMALVSPFVWAHLLASEGKKMTPFASALNKTVYAAQIMFVIGSYVFVAWHNSR